MQNCISYSAPLHNRKKIREEQLHCSDSSHPNVLMENLLVFLYRQGGDQCTWFWRELVCWVAWMIDMGPCWASASADPIDIPAPRGPKRARRLKPEMLNVLGKMAGEGSVARTGSKPSHVLQFASRRRGLWQGCATSTANRAQGTRAQLYRDSAAEKFFHEHVNILSVAFDASRVAGRDTLYTALYAPEKSLACWGDPMVPPVSVELKVVLCEQQIVTSCD